MGDEADADTTAGAGARASARAGAGADKGAIFAKEVLEDYQERGKES